MTGLDDDPVLRIAERIGRGVTEADDEHEAWMAAVVAGEDTQRGRQNGPRQPLEHADRVAGELARRRARAEAEQILTGEAAQRVTIAPAVRLDEFITQPDPPVTFRIDGLWPAGGRVLFAAQAKAGKSTAVAEVIRCLVDGYPLFDRFDVHQVRCVTLIDDEMSPSQLRRWLRDHDVINTDRVQVRCLRGQVHTFGITDDALMSRWVADLAGTDVLVLDCVRPVLDAIGLDESFEAGKFLVAFDRLLAAAGIGEALAAHHMGHSGERARGSSRLLDWPDVTWRLLTQPGDDDGAEPVRYFTAYGRDVDVAETALTYHPDTRRLSWAQGSRRDAGRPAAVRAVLTVVHAHPEGLTSNGIEQLAASDAVPVRAVRDARHWAVRHGCLEVVTGPRRSKVHTLNTSLRRTATVAPSQWCDECVSASLKDALHSHSPTATTTTEPLVAVEGIEEELPDER